MSGLKPITVNTAPEADPHIYAEDDAAIYQSIFGSDGVMTIGQQCASQVISNNKVRVKDGVIIVGGHVARIPYGEYIDCEIANGQSGKNRNDIIIAKFVTTGSGGIDTYTCEVKQGVAGSSASDPALTQNDIYAGGKIREMPLYRVKIEGLSIVAVEQLFKLVPTIPELEEQLADLNSNIVRLYSQKSALPGGWTEITVPHGLESEPQYIFVTPYCSKKYRITFVVTRDAENIIISVYNWESSSVNVGFWIEARI